MKSLFFVLPALLLGLTACGAPVAAVTLPDTVQVEKTQTAETAVLYEDADGREVSPHRADAQYLYISCIISHIIVASISID